MAFVLAPSAVSEGYRIETFDSVDSTNAVALERARSGDAGPIWIVSDLQLAGRGRRGRAWQTQRGNLAASLLMAPEVPLREAATLGFVAGLALSDALDALLPSPVAVGVDGGATAQGGRFELKWPNDVLSAGAKLSGILLETVVTGPDRVALVIGIGVNVVTEPADVPYPATSLRALGSVVDAAHLFLALSDAWVDNHRLWRSIGGLDAIRRKWLGRAAGLGSQVAVNLDGRIVRGIFETIDEDCRFVIREVNGDLTRIAAGDVHFGAVASAPNEERAGA